MSSTKTPSKLAGGAAGYVDDRVGVAKATRSEAMSLIMHGTR